MDGSQELNDFVAKLTDVGPASIAAGRHHSESWLADVTSCSSQYRGLHMLAWLSIMVGIGWQFWLNALRTKLM